MEKFIIVSEAQATIKIQYIVEADSLAEAEVRVIEGEYRGEGEIMSHKIHWETEAGIVGWNDKEGE
jgi:hypothetical protein